MGELKFYELKCRRCGGELEALSGGMYRCKSCGKAFKEQIVEDVADKLRNVLNEQKQEAVANLRTQLWHEMQETAYINSAKIVGLARDIKKYLPEDYFANFCEVANSGNNKEVNAFLNSTTKEQMADYADVVLDFMLKSLKSANITAVSLFIENAFKGDIKNYDKCTTALEKEAEKVNNGIYDLILTRDVFLAYSSADMPQVLELCDYLESNKITCFLALRNLRHGRGAVDNYDQALKTAIDNCKTVVFVSSAHSRDMGCDALTKELPYIRQKDIEVAPAECKRAYDRLPAEYMMPRVEYLIEDYCGNVAEMVTKEFFHGLEWCKSKEAVAARITKYLTETHETPAQKAERENRELQLKIAQLQSAQNSAPKISAETPQTIKDKFASGKKYCFNCKSFADKSAKFCPECGGERFAVNYGEYLAGRIKFCAQCGTQNNESDKFCIQCGSREFVFTKKEYEQSLLKREEEALQRNFNVQNNVLIRYKGNDKEVLIPKNITGIGDEAFKGCENVVKVTMRSGVKNIGKSAFFYCDALTSVSIPDSVTAIADKAFSYCVKLTRLILPDGVNSIGEMAFSHCNKITSIIIPESVTYVGCALFDGCANLKTIYCRTKKSLFGMPKGWNKEWLKGCKAKVIWDYKGYNLDSLI